MNLIKQSRLRQVSLAVLATLACGAATALPTLQLGILGASYDLGTQTSIAPASTFKLYAFLNPGDDTALSDGDYFVSAALAPQVKTAANLGSFKYAGSSYNATGDMTYGSPPLGAIEGAGGELQSHSIFDTYFSEFKFNFNADNKASSVNVQDNASLGGVSFNTNGVGALYWAAFDVDVGLLSPTMNLHFDLYNSTVQKCKGKATCSTTIGVDDFAPFSHDAQSGSGGGGGGGGGTGGSGGGGGGTGGSGGGNDVPEPASLALVAIGLAAACWKRKPH
ncbi:choice-of-anchor N protein [Roseateles oligotrophus]|uniref:Choice-of-anchor N protein n=1 Tax=Roseateles oligotrophus TaxID=1769250 RepID=A0ABT2YGR8_9BURK|nr:choice-of-anchor N protein [Roseateles oligotrophus]MCV2369243.1 choice-of-anchor N protein [Roseateles oligotrophus]